MDEFKVVGDEKDAIEEKLEKNLKKLHESQRISKLVKEEKADIDVIIGILMQVRGLINFDKVIADAISENVDDIFTIAKAMIRNINKNIEVKNDDHGSF